MAPLLATLLSLMLATPALGVPLQSNMEGVLKVCQESHMKCDADIIYRCHKNAWVEYGHCTEPTWCESDLAGKKAWCASSTELKKRTVPSPSPSVTTAPAELPPGWCTAAQTRCDGNNLQICNDHGKWEWFESCAECLQEGEKATCIPHITTSTTVTAPQPTPTKSTQTDKPPTAQPTGSLSFSPAWDDPCFAGEVRCVGSDRIEACSAERNWEDFGPCPHCKQLYNTAVNCSFDDLGLTIFWSVDSISTSALEIQEKM
ncbi:hypothetical protein F4821DRAFT_226192 [Hypoxylon rubiginosum]|uniref:Uncharacterized protein n=1 Tax=Hypoxylon rubiginosum TaxID=110542 RepID=A0ACC0DFK3_9PEZI|nr:hypothetical protein F4821DRAFT_226192 [Hypoxylon rubiginosum]